MVLPVAPSQISHSDIMAEFGHPANTQWKISSDGAPYINFTPSTIIKESDFYGKSNTPATVKIYDYREDPLPKGESTGNSTFVDAYSDMIFTAPGSPHRTGDTGWIFRTSGGRPNNTTDHDNYFYDVNVGSDPFVPASPKIPTTPGTPAPTTPLSGGLPIPSMGFRYGGAGTATFPELQTWFYLKLNDSTKIEADQTAMITSGMTGLIFEIDAYLDMGTNANSGIDVGFTSLQNFVPAIMNNSTDGFYPNYTGGIDGIEIIGPNASISGATVGAIATGRGLSAVKRWTVTTRDKYPGFRFKSPVVSPTPGAPFQSAGAQDIVRYYLASIYMY